MDQMTKVNRPITSALSKIFEGISELREAFPSKAFTIDGRLVGDIGEILAALEYDLELYPSQQVDYDGVTPAGKRVQVKATFQRVLSFKSVPDYYFGLRLYEDGRHEEIFNGPGRLSATRYMHRKGIGLRLLSFPITHLALLSKQVAESDRIPKRASAEVQLPAAPHAL